MQTHYLAIFKTMHPSSPPRWNMRKTGFHFRMCGYYVRIGSFY